MKKNVEITIEKARGLIKDSNCPDGLKDSLKQAFGDELNKVKHWKDLGKINGFFINTRSGLHKADRYRCEQDINVFATESEALSMLAYAQITQLLASDEYNGEPTEKWCDYNSDDTKYAIIDTAFRLDVSCFQHLRDKIVFKTRELAEKFRTNELELLKSYFQMD